MKSSLARLSSAIQLLIACEANAQFQVAPEISREFIDEPNEMISHDLDGDGDLDQIVSGSVLVLLENTDGQGTWAVHEMTQQFLSAISRLQFVDVDQDGLMDLTFSVLNSSTHWQKNLGSLVFLPPAEILSDSSYPFWADLNGDGALDIVDYGQINWTMGVRFHPNLGGGLFGAPVAIHSSIELLSFLHAFDMDLDGDQDVIFRIGQQPMMLRLMRNDGGGVFTQQWAFPVPNCTVNDVYPGVFVLDIDNDGLHDIVERKTCNAGSHTLSCRRNLGGGNFTGMVDMITFPDPVLRIEVINMNNDPYPDLITTHNQQLRTALGIGPGFFASSSVALSLLPFGSPSTSLLHTTDLDFNDDAMDLLLGDIQFNRLYHFTCHGSGTLVLKSRERLEGIRAHSDELHLADMNNDGYPDLIRNSDLEGWLVMYTGLGGGLFSISKVIHSETWPEQLEVLDMNGDGLLDIVALTTSAFRVLTNQGESQFQVSYSMLQTNFGDRFIMADFDGDGDMDIIVEHGDNLRRVRNDGPMGFFPYYGTYTVLHFAGASARPVGTMDVDGDGDLDLIVQTDLQNYWVRNSGGMTFDQRFAIPTLGPEASGIMDVDMDGSLDIVGGSNQLFASRAWWSRNLGGGQFGPYQDLLSGQQYGYNYATIGDINADGAPDVVMPVQGPDGGFIRLNDGTGSFGPLQPIGLGDLHPRESFRPYLVDVDGDLDNELICFTEYGTLSHGRYGLGLSMNVTNVTTELPSWAEPQSLRAIPNPCADATVLMLPDGMEGPLRISLMDALGHELRTYTSSSANSCRLNLSGVPAGVYLAVVLDQRGARFTLRLALE